MAEEILALDEFNELPEEEQAEKIIHYRKVYTDREIRQAWGLTIHYFNKKLRELNVGKKTPSILEESEGDTGNTSVSVRSRKTTAPVDPSPSEGLRLSLQGTYAGDVLYQKLSKLLRGLYGDSNEFEIALSITEVKK